MQLRTPTTSTTCTPPPTTPMPPAPYFSQPRPNAEPARLGFRFRSTNRSPRSARARSLYFGLPPLPPLDLSIPASHNLKDPFRCLFHIQSTLPANNFHPRLLASATHPLLASSGGCPAPSRSLQLPLAGKCPRPT